MTRSHLILLGAAALLSVACRTKTNGPAPAPAYVPEEDETIEVVVEDATGTILGIKVNEVGDYYIINPSNEEMIPMEGHSIKKISPDQEGIN